MCYNIIFFCKAENAIRITSVTGIQTCALPICRPPSREDVLSIYVGIRPLVSAPGGHVGKTSAMSRGHTIHFDNSGLMTRSEERRVGKGSILVLVEWLYRRSTICIYVYVLHSEL